MTENNDEQIRILKEMLKWLRFSGMKEVKSALLSTLDSEQKKLIYHLSDGNRTSLDIGKASGVSDWTVRNYWKTWARAGIVESLRAGAGERYRHSFELGDFGIDIPKSKPDSAVADGSSEVATAKTETSEQIQLG